MLPLGDDTACFCSTWMRSSPYASKRKHGVVASLQDMIGFRWLQTEMLPIPIFLLRATSQWDSQPKQHLRDPTCAAGSILKKKYFLARGRASAMSCNT